MKEELNQTDIKVQEKKEFKDIDTQTDMILYKLPKCSCKVEHKMINFNFADIHLDISLNQQKKLK